MLSPPTNVDWPPLMPAIGVTPMSSSLSLSLAMPWRLAGMGMMPMLPCGKNPVHVGPCSSCVPGPVMPSSNSLRNVE